ncbi:putative chromatin regulator PHD family [Helianthus annuus]|nr:putative chromatin regulator PHD family [Helianthus annuus]
MQENDWLSLVAVHSDAWLLSVAFYFGARFGFDKADRKRLFNMINELPTIFEVVSGNARKHTKERSSVTNHSNNKSKSTHGEIHDDEEHGDTLCGACGENYASDEFWICCDMCERWFHGACVKITPAKAQHIKHYKCPACTAKRPRP